MTVHYEIVETPSGNTVVNATFDNSSVVLSIPMDPANADYQAYLNRDNPDWGKPLL
jgi:hypothetical protein